MKALFIGSDPTIFTPESPARTRLKRYAAEIGTLHVLSRGPHATDLEDGPLHLHAVDGGKLAALHAMQGKARRLIKEQGIEIVSAQDPFEHGWVAYQAKKGTSAKLHLQVHTDFCSPWFVKGTMLRAAHVQMPVLNTIRRSIADRIIPRADGIRAVSERVKASLIGRYGDRPISVIPIAGPESLPPRVALPPHPFSFAFVTVGRLEPEKRIEDAIDALARVARTYPMVGLIVIGDGRSRRRLMKRARMLGLGERVMFLGWRSDALGLMQSAQAYIQTSAYEGYSLTLLEAARARVPIITTDVGIVGEVFTGYEDVLVAPVADPAALAVHIAGLVEDVQARQSLVRNAERKAAAHLASIGDQPARIAEDLARTLAAPR
ncbi:MAG TPA: glycosyltransferase [Candidatus Paceibacterota bacterium]|nr:glycosyltransferase [Candidatus Paceibacterota bacterium]